MKQRSIYHYTLHNDLPIVLIEDAIFTLTSYESDEKGGNIYIETALHCVQNRVCCYNCSLNNEGKHSCIYAGNAAEFKNYIIQCSFSELSGGGTGAFVHAYGEFQINQTNITNCKNNVCSCFVIAGLSTNSTVIDSEFNNNTATSSTGLDLNYANSFTHKVSRCNIISQTCGSGKGVIMVWGYAIIDSCVIKDNYTPDQILFFVYGKRGFLITNCYIDKKISEEPNIKISNTKLNPDDLKIYYSPPACPTINFRLMFSKKQSDTITHFTKY